MVYETGSQRWGRDTEPEENRFADVVTNSEPEMQAAIQSGEVVSGMTRDQVIAARGYPPSHVTQSYQTDDIWKYWDRRAETRQVFFVNDVVYFGK